MAYECDEWTGRLIQDLLSVVQVWVTDIHMLPSTTGTKKRMKFADGIEIG